LFFNHIITTVLLHEAASNGKEQICRLLIENQERDEDISIEESNAYGNTQLHTAVTAGNVDIVRLLIEKDFDINAQNHIGSNALHICAFLATAITKDEINSKEALQKSATKSLMVQPHLQIAAILLSNKNFKMLNEKDHNGQTSLHIASQRGCNEMVKLLVDSGADISIRTSIDAKGRGGRNAKDVAQFAGMTDTYNLLNDIEHCIEKYVSKTLATDIQTGYSISNPIVGSGALGLRKNSKTH
jgi:ankyrin repeat protein